MNYKPRITLTKGVLKKEPVIYISFEYQKDINNKIKSIPQCLYSFEKQIWYIPTEHFNLNAFFNYFQDVAYIDYSNLKKPITLKKINTKIKTKSKIKIPQAYLDVLDQKRYSDSTKAMYTYYFADFIRYFQNSNLDKIKLEEINQYILSLIREKDISTSQQNQRINAIKFYFEKVKGNKRIIIDIKRPRKEKRLPVVLSASEILDMINNTNNIKHKCIISVLYSGGLRRSEIINLKISDILSKQMLIRIQQSKGKKDRYVGLSNYLLKLLRQYIKEYSPQTWLFEGKSGQKYSPESVGNIVKKAGKIANIKINVTPHILRHSFATHHLEQGTDLRYIQHFLGHSSSKTTEIYTKVASKDLLRFKNPLDNLFDTS